nr:hypothetical protein CFP56_01007 [Quercus suber]
MLEVDISLHRPFVQVCGCQLHEGKSHDIDDSTTYNVVFSSTGTVSPVTPCFGCRSDCVLLTNALARARNPTSLAVTRSGLYALLEVQYVQYLVGDLPRHPGSPTHCMLVVCSSAIGTITLIQAWSPWMELLDKRSGDARGSRDDLHKSWRRTPRPHISPRQRHLHFGDQVQFSQPS